MIEIINLINGKLGTRKVKHLDRAIDQLNALHNTNLEKLPLDISNQESKARLVGFSDANGHFQIRLQGSYRLKEFLSMVRSKVKCIFSIKQRVIYKPTGDSCVLFITKIAYLFNFKIRIDR